MGSGFRRSKTRKPIFNRKAGPSKDDISPNVPGTRISELAALTGDNPTRGLQALRDVNIEPSTLQNMGRRNELAAAQVSRWKRDPWRGEGYTIKAETEEIKAQVEDVFKQIDADEIISRCFAMEKVLGMSLFHIALPENSGPIDKSPDAEALKAIVKKFRKRTEDEKGRIHYDYSKTINKAEAISRLKIEKYIIDEVDKLPLEWVVKTGGKVDALEQKINVHRDRVVHFSNWVLDNSPWGTSEFISEYDVLNDLRNISVAMTEAYTKMATGIGIIHVPPDTPNDVYTYVKNNWKDLDMMSEFILPENSKNPDEWMKAEILSWGGTAASPKEFFDAIYSRFSTVSQISKVILQGTESGKLTGSELNFKEFYGLIAVWRNQLDRRYQDLISKLQEWGYIDPGTVELEWDPVDKPTANEASKTSLLESQGFKIAVEGVKTLMSTIDGDLAIYKDKAYVVTVNRDKKFIGFEVPLMGEILEDFTEKELNTLIKYIYPDPNTPEEPEPEEEEPPEGEEIPPEFLPTENALRHAIAMITDAYPKGHTDAVKLTPEELKKVRNEWVFPFNRTLDAVKADMSRGTLEGIDFGADKWIADFESLAEKVGYKADNVDLEEGAGKLQVGTQAIKFDQKLLDKNTLADLEEALRIGWDETAALLDLPAGEFSVGMPWAADWLELNASSFVGNNVKGVTTEMLNAMTEGLRAGEGYRDITKRIKGAVASYKDRTFKGVFKVTHQALNSSRIEAAKSAGTASAEKPLVYITMGDEIVRPEHRDREGQFYPPDEMEVLLSEWNCRCTSVPSLGIERIMGRALTPEELGGTAPV